MLKLLAENDICVPLTVPASHKKIYIKNYLSTTHRSGRFFLFAGDQKIEHLNDDFIGSQISSESIHPHHLFEIANQAPISAFATQLGLIAHYGRNYPNINYIVKLNAKTNIIPTAQHDPRSGLLTTVDQVVAFKEASKLLIVGVGFTVYLGSVYEYEMLQQASQAIYQAHQHGLLTILWMYPRGKAITNERDAHLIAGAAGVGVSLGADFVKVNPPQNGGGKQSPELLKEACAAAGKTGVICSGGSMRIERSFLEELYNQLHTGTTKGVAIGRNIHQKSVADAVRFCKAVATLVFDDADLESAYSHLSKEKR